MSTKQSYRKCSKTKACPSSDSFQYPTKVFGLSFEEGFRADLIVEDSLLIELKSVSQLAPVHSKQVLTYLRLLNLPLGLLINYGSPTFKEGIKRILNGPQNLTNSPLEINRPSE
ncbi:MAG: GxxExxY protein [Akkermansiaceae bacterium]|nr:GxxExxY protein [Akkermansiaceae bacterium]MDP4720102.1 GxxExxY protein [Akkermansiaceae bacterium]